MMLITFFGLIATINLDSGHCDVGTQGADDYDFTKSTGTRPWYPLLYFPNDFDNKLDCLVVYYGRPEGTITVQARVISDDRHVTFNGSVANWNSTGFEASNLQSSNWNRRFQVIAFDYNQFKILKHSAVDTDQIRIYVQFRNRRPGISTILEVLKKLKKNNIDFYQLVEWKTDKCQQAESSTELGSCA